MGVRHQSHHTVSQNHFIPNADHVFNFPCFSKCLKLLNRVFSTEAEIEATRNVIINGSTIHLVNANDADDGAAADTVWAHLDQAQVGQMVRILINTTNTGWHYEAPYVGVTGCWFYDQPPENPDAMQFNLVDQYGCNKPPSYYDPFTAADTPRVNGMLLNKQPVDSIDPSSAAADPTAQAGTPSAGYLSGPQEKGVAYSDKLKMFKFPGSGVVYSKCTLRFCVEWDDPRCITVSFIPRFKDLHVIIQQVINTKLFVCAATLPRQVLHRFYIRYRRIRNHLPAAKEAGGGRNRPNGGGLYGRRRHRHHCPERWNYNQNR
jgi:hypothetical protein